MAAPTTAAVLEALIARLGQVTDAPVYAPALPANKPDRAIAVSVYQTDTSRDVHNPDYYVQIRVRTGGDDVRTTLALADQVFAALDDRVNERSGSEWPGARILFCYRHIAGPATPDGNGRYTRPDSYTLTANPTS